MTRTTAQGFCAEPTPVIIRGIMYPSQYAAAKALGVPQSTIYTSLERGSLDRVGLGRNHNRKIQMTANGALYESIAEAARAHGHNPQGVTKEISRAKKKGQTRMKHKGVDYTW